MAARVLKQVDLTSKQAESSLILPLFEVRDFFGTFRPLQRPVTEGVGLAWNSGVHIPTIA